MRVQIIFSQVGKIPDLAEQLAQELEKSGQVSATLTKAEPSGTLPISCANYDLIILGGPVLGFLGGKLPVDLPPTVTRCTRLDGRSAAAFVGSKLLGTQKSLKAVMALLEKQGALVEDFAALGSTDDVKRFSQRLIQLMESRRKR